MENLALFTTKDGIDINIGDTYYYIHPNFPKEIRKCEKAKDLDYNKYLLYSSTDKAVETYILMNEEGVTGNELIKLGYITTEPLMKLLKEKIKIKKNY